MRTCIEEPSWIPEMLRQYPSVRTLVTFWAIGYAYIRIIFRIGWSWTRRTRASRQMVDVYGWNVTGGFAIGLVAQFLSLGLACKGILIFDGATAGVV